MIRLAAFMMCFMVASPSKAETIQEILADQGGWIGKIASIDNLICASSFFEDKRLNEVRKSPYACFTKATKDEIVVINMIERPGQVSDYLDYVCYTERFGFKYLISAPECEPTVASFQILAVGKNSVGRTEIKVKVVELKFEQPNPVDAVNFLGDWGDLQKKNVTVRSCNLSNAKGHMPNGNTPCSVGNSARGRNKILIDRKTFAQESYRRYLKECTRNGWRTECVVELIGTPSGVSTGMPIMRDVHAIWPSFASEPRDTVAQATPSSVKAEPAPSPVPAEPPAQPVWAGTFDEQFRKELDYKPAAEWESKGPEAIKRVSRKVLDTMWGQKGSLWIEVKEDGTDWTKAGRSFCLTLRGAGKPEGTLVILTFWMDGETGAKVTCD